MELKQFFKKMLVKNLKMNLKKLKVILILNIYFFNIQLKNNLNIILRYKNLIIKQIIIEK